MRNLVVDKEICDRATPGPWNSHDKADYAEIHNGDTWGKALSPIALVGYAEEDATFIAASREGWPHAIERALKAEAEVSNLKDDKITLFLDYDADYGEMEEEIRGLRAEVERLQTENAQLLKVVDAARALVPSEIYQYTRHLYALKHTLDEYDKAKEGQDGKSI